MKIANVWTERVTFVACPECGEVEDLGAGIVVTPGEDWDCPGCQKTSKLDSVEDEE